MKKLLLILELIPLFAMGQKEHVVKEYCYVLYIKGKAKISLAGKESEYITDSIGNDMKFSGSLSIFNYMSEQGWELHPAQPEFMRSGGSIPEYLFYRNKENKKEGE